MTKLYHHWSHFNFKPEQWQEAAQRFLSLRSNIAAAEKEDAEINHDPLNYNFEKCAVCEQISEMQDHEEEFAKEFAPIWASKALEAVKEDSHV